MFTLKNIQSIPMPKRSFLLALLLFAVSATWIVCHFKPHFTTLTGHWERLVRNERTERYNHPEIILAGSSLAMHGVDCTIIEKRTSMSTCNCSAPACTPGTVVKILTRLEKTAKSSKVLLMELNPERLRGKSVWNNDIGIYYDDYFAYHAGEFPDPLGNLDECRAYLLREYKFPKQDFCDFLNWIKGKTPTNYATNKTREREQRNTWAKLPKRDTPVAELSPGIPKSYSDLEEAPSEFQAVRDIHQICRDRGVFLVVLVLPQWYGQLNLSEQDLLNPPANDYIALLQELKAQPDCDVIVCDDFKKITGEGTDEDYLLDYGHMTPKGAEVYTNWLLDRIGGTPKIAGRFSHDDVLLR